MVPTVETMLELREQKLYEHALPELEDELNRCARRADFQPEGELKLLVCFGIARDERFESFGRLLFDWFRCPALEVIVEPGDWLSIDRIRPRNITRLANGEGEFFRESLHQHTKREWRDPKARTRRQIRPRGALRSEREDGAVLAGVDQAFRAHRREACRSTSSRSPSASSPSSPNSTACSSARPPRSTITPTASPAAPGRKACRSSTIRSR